MQFARAKALSAYKSSSIEVIAAVRASSSPLRSQSYHRNPNMKLGRRTNSPHQTRNVPPPNLLRRIRPLEERRRGTGGTSRCSVDAFLSSSLGNNPGQPDNPQHAQLTPAMSSTSRTPKPGSRCKSRSHPASSAMVSLRKDCGMIRKR